MRGSWSGWHLYNFNSAIINPRRATGHGVYIQHTTPIYSLITLQYILSVCVLMKIKYSFNSMASWEVKERGSCIGEFWEFLELNHSLCSRLPHCIISRKSLTFPWSNTVVLSLRVPGPRALASPGNLLKIQITGPSPDSLSQKFWGWSTAICV